MKITQDQVTEFGVHRFCVEASELGLRPGQFPQVVELNLGNGQPFVRVRSNNESHVHYRQANGCLSLYILND